MKPLIIALAVCLASVGFAKKPAPPKPKATQVERVDALQFQLLQAKKTELEKARAEIAAASKGMEAEGAAYNSAAVDFEKYLLSTYGIEVGKGDRFLLSAPYSISWHVDPPKKPEPPKVVVTPEAPKNPDGGAAPPK